LFLSTSQQQLIDCLDFDGCKGGSPDRGWEHIGAIGGQVTNASYPYANKVIYLADWSFF